MLYLSDIIFQKKLMSTGQDCKNVACSIKFSLLNNNIGLVWHDLSMYNITNDDDIVLRVSWGGGGGGGG